MNRYPKSYEEQVLSKYSIRFDIDYVYLRNGRKITDEQLIGIAVIELGKYCKEEENYEQFFEIKFDSKDNVFDLSIYHYTIHDDIYYDIQTHDADLKTCLDKAIMEIYKE